MTKNIPKLMIENITDPESSENTKKTKYQKCLHLGIYLSCVKPKKRNYWKKPEVEEGWKLPIQEQKSELEQFPSEAVQVRNSVVKYLKC